ncbi:ROK family protein [Neptunicella sp.]|uniref:ROK family protein n=1 Tax=Neptunicella sp. TaxID=2125986 RepID=UPI003F6916A9
MTTFIYGIDIGGTKMELSVFDANYHCVKSWRVATPAKDYQLFLKALREMVHQADILTGCQGHVGIGMPGIINKQGLVKSANVPCATGKAIKKDIEQVLQRHIAIENDCRLFALSESNGGAGDGYAIVYGAIIGTGAGGGLCIQGNLYSGANNIAGEYGHLPASAELIAKYQLPILDCGCGLTGCYEPYISGPGLANIYALHGGTPDTQIFVNQLRAADPAAVNAFECYIDLLGASFASIVLSYDPDIIVLGGGLSKIDEIISALPAAIEKHLFKGVQSPVIAPAMFGDASGARGAALLGAIQ